jgi:hypothetical protein
MCSCVFDLLLKNKQKPALMMRPQGRIFLQQPLQDQEVMVCCSRENQGRRREQRAVASANGPYIGLILERCDPNHLQKQRCFVEELIQLRRERALEAKEQRHWDFGS